MHIPDAPAHLRPLLRRLLAEADTGISQHLYTPHPDEWFAGRGDYGDLGPYDSAEAAIVGMVRYLWRGLDEARSERDALVALAKVALDLGETEDYFHYVAGRDTLRKAAKAYRMAEAAREWEGRQG